MSGAWQQISCASKQMNKQQQKKQLHFLGLHRKIAAAKSLQSCLTLCDPIDGSPPGSPVPGILQARTLELVAISFSSAWKWKVKVKSLSRVWLFATPWTAAHQAPLSMGFSRQEYWSGVPLPSEKLLVTSKSFLKIHDALSLNGPLEHSRCYLDIIFVPVFMGTSVLWNLSGT